MQYSAVTLRAHIDGNNMVRGLSNSDCDMLRIDGATAIYLNKEFMRALNAFEGMFSYLIACWKLS
jgi:hypothetical protein